MQKHIEAIKSGTVTKTNVIGIRKALNTYERMVHGWSVSRSAPRVTSSETFEVQFQLASVKPLVTGELHDSGIKHLQQKRYAKQLAQVADIVADIRNFRLVKFVYRGTRNEYSYPVFRCYSNAGYWFDYVNIPWQSGGNGPEILDTCYFSA